MQTEKTSSSAQQMASSPLARLGQLGTSTKDTAHAAFLRRVASYTAQRWFDKSYELNPLVCALLGFECVGVDLLRCVDCGNCVVVKNYVSCIVPDGRSDGGGVTRVQVPWRRVLCEKLLQGHSAECIYRQQSALRFDWIKFQGVDFKKVADVLIKRMRPVLEQLRARRDVSVELASLLREEDRRRANECRDSAWNMMAEQLGLSTDDDVSLSDFSKAFFVVLFGWAVAATATAQDSAPEGASSSFILHCSHCATEWRPLLPQPAFSISGKVNHLSVDPVARHKWWCPCVYEGEDVPLAELLRSVFAPKLADSSAAPTDSAPVTSSIAGNKLESKKLVVPGWKQLVSALERYKDWRARTAAPPVAPLLAPSPSSSSLGAGGKDVYDVWRTVHEILKDSIAPSFMKKHQIKVQIRNEQRKSQQEQQQRQEEDRANAAREEKEREENREVERQEIDGMQIQAPEIESQETSAPQHAAPEAAEQTAAPDSRVGVQEQAAEHDLSNQPDLDELMEEFIDDLRGDQMDVGEDHPEGVLGTQAQAAVAAAAAPAEAATAPSSTVAEISMETDADNAAITAEPVQISKPAAEQPPAISVTAAAQPDSAEAAPAAADAPTHATAAATESMKPRRIRRISDAIRLSVSAPAAAAPATETAPAAAGTTRSSEAVTQVAAAAPTAVAAATTPSAADSKKVITFKSLSKEERMQKILQRRQQQARSVAAPAAAAAAAAASPAAAPSQGKRKRAGSTSGPSTASASATATPPLTKAAKGGRGQGGSAKSGGVEKKTKMRKKPSGK